MLVPSPQESNRFARQLFAGLPPRYDLLAELLSLGQNRRWRQAMVAEVASVQPTRVLDVATGTGGVALLVADRTKAHVTGLDLTEAMLRQAQRAVMERRRSHRLHLVVGQGEELPFPDSSFDAVTFTYLLRYVADPRATIAELARVVRPGGMLASVEFLVPDGVWRGAWWLYTRALLPVAAYVTGGRAWYEVGRFLGPSISRHYQRYPLAWHLRAWQDAGLEDVGVRRMSLGGGLVMWGYKTHE